VLRISLSFLCLFCFRFRKKKEQLPGKSPSLTHTVHTQAEVWILPSCESSLLSLQTPKPTQFANLIWKWIGKPKVTEHRKGDLEPQCLCPSAPRCPLCAYPNQRSSHSVFFTGVNTDLVWIIIFTPLLICPTGGMHSAGWNSGINHIKCSCLMSMCVNNPGDFDFYLEVRLKP
jgi:hypothetical protein